MAHFHFFSFYLSFFHSCFLFLFFLSSLFFQIWLYEMLRLLHPATVFPSQYLPKHYCDRRPKGAEMSSDEFTEFMKHIDVIDIQWVVEWWCLTFQAWSITTLRITMFLWLGFMLFLQLYMPHCKAIW